MLGPNLALILPSKQSLSVYKQVLNQNFVQSSDLLTLIHAVIVKFNIF